MNFYIACIYTYFFFVNIYLPTCNIFYNFLNFFENAIDVNMLYFTLVRKHILNKPLINYFIYLPFEALE